MSEYTGPDCSPYAPQTTTKGATPSALDMSQVAFSAAPNYQGTPTEYYDKNGQLIGYLANGNNVMSASGLNFVNPDGTPNTGAINKHSLIQATDENGNLLYNPAAQTQAGEAPVYSTQCQGAGPVVQQLAGQMKMNAPSPGLLQDPLFRNFGLSAAAMGAGAALAPAASGALGTSGDFIAADAASSQAGQSAFNAASALGMPLDQAVTSGLIAADGSLTAEGAATLMGTTVATDAAGTAAGGLTGAQALQYAKTALGALGTASTIASLANKLMGGSGSGSSGGSSGGSGGGLSGGSKGNNAAAQIASMTPDTSAQIFRVGQTAKDPLAKLVTQPITELTPEYKNIQQTYGCAQTAAKGGLIGGLGHYASGGSTSDKKNLFCFKDSEPKFDEQRPELLMGRVSNSKVEPMVLKQIKTGISGYARGGLPEKYHAATPEGHHPEFITGLTGYYACGGGTGQSDDIPAMLHDGDYVMDAETVSALGDGSSKAGMHVLEGFRSQVPYKNAPGGNPVPAKIADGEYVFPAAFVTALGRGDNKRGSEILDGLREKLRAHKRGAPLDKIPPKAKSPLDYIQKGKK